MGLMTLTSGGAPTLARDSVIVVIPVYDGHAHVVESVTAALEHTPTDVPFCIINDASTDPQIRTFVEQLGQSGKLNHELYYIEHDTNVGFVASCNEAFELFAPADVVLLNSDCVVSEGWLEAMRAAAASDARVATVSVMANSATILSIPERNEPIDGIPEGMTIDEAAERVARSSLRSRPEIPTAVGHCVLIRRSTKK